MFIVDASGSVRKSFGEELKLAARVVKRLRLGEEQAKVAMIQFAGPYKSRVIFHFK